MKHAGDGEHDAFDPDVEDLVGLYLKDVGEKARLTPEEEVDLAQRVDEGDKEAKDRLVNANLLLVPYIAKKVAKQNEGGRLNFGDLIEVGNEALLRAAERFDWRKGYRFSTYATACIRGAMRDALVDRELLTSLFARRVNPTGAADESRESVDVKDSKAEDPEETVVRNERTALLEDLLATLTAEEQDILTLRFGLQDGHLRTPEEVARQLGVATEYIDQVEGGALMKLRHSPGAERLKGLFSEGTG